MAKNVYQDDRNYTREHAPLLRQLNHGKTNPKQINKNITRRLISTELKVIKEVWNTHLINKNHAMIVELLDDHIANSCLAWCCTSRDTWYTFLNYQQQQKNSKSFWNMRSRRGEERVPMTKGCLRELMSSEAVERGEGGRRDFCGEEGAEERSPSRRRPEKWGPVAASIASSTL